MPIYDFKCQDCKEAFTVSIPVNEKNKVVCPKCASSTIIQLFTGVTVFTGKDCVEAKVKRSPYS
jgi:putative FmdB family regulatory protein